MLSIKSAARIKLTFYFLPCDSIGIIFVAMSMWTDPIWNLKKNTLIALTCRERQAKNFRAVVRKKHNKPNCWSHKVFCKSRVKVSWIEFMSDGSLLLLDDIYWLVSAIWQVFIIPEFKSCSALVLLQHSCHLLQCINSCELAMKGRRKTLWTHPTVLCTHQLTRAAGYLKLLARPVAGRDHLRHKMMIWATGHFQEFLCRRVHLGKHTQWGSGMCRVVKWGAASSPPARRH